MSILSVFLQRKEGCAVEDCTALGFCFSCSFLRSGSLFILFAGPPPCTRRPLLKKGSIRKLFCGWQHTFYGRAKNPGFRIFCFGVGLWTQSTAPSRTLFAGLRPAPGDPFFKRGRSENFLCGRATHFLGKGEEPGMPEPLILGNRSMDTVRRPLCGCFVLSCMVGGIFRKPLGFRRRLPPARPEKALPFQVRSPGTKH